MFSATVMRGTAAFLQRLLRQAEDLEAVHVVAHRLEGLAVDEDAARCVGSRWPERTSISSDWPLPETPAMPTISPAWTLRFTASTAGRPWSSSAKRPASSSTTGASANGLRAARSRILVSPIIIRLISSIESVADRAGADQPAVAEHGDVVGEGGHLAELVGDHQDGELAGLGHAAQEAEHLVGLAGGQHRGRLVEDEEALVEIELLEDLELLLLAGGEARDRHVERHAERHAVEEGRERRASPSASR